MPYETAYKLGFIVVVFDNQFYTQERITEIITQLDPPPLDWFQALNNCPLYILKVTSGREMDYLEILNSFPSVSADLMKDPIFA